MSDHDKDRSAITGRYVSDEFADENPATTVSELRGRVNIGDDLAALARHALGHATREDHGRILRMAGEGEAKDHESPLPAESWEAVNPPRPGSV